VVLKKISMDGNHLATTTFHSSIIDWNNWGNKKEQNLFLHLSDVGCHANAIIEKK
jgi:hypothetical protein